MLGELPGYYCYDANRPSWLPTWIDTISESMCKWKPSTIAGNIYHCGLNDSTCQEPSGDGLNPTLSGPGILGTDVGSNAPNTNGVNSWDFTTLGLVVLGIGLVMSFKGK